MPWQELTFELTADQVGPFEDALLELGALSITLRDAADQPLMEPAPETTPLWDQLRLTAMFDMESDIKRMLVSLAEQPSLSPLPDYRIEVLADQEWRRTWMAHFKPMQFGRRLWILPSGYDPIEKNDAVVIDLDPGLAFGTGSHPTTSLCLEWLDANTCKDKVVVDYGCGSGILAIAAAKLGAQQVIAVDNDPQALEATCSNAANNHVDHRIDACLPQDFPDTRADILLANILLEPLLGLPERFASVLPAGGRLVVSGILELQRQQLQQKYGPWFTFDACGQQQEWVRLDAIRNDP